MSRVAVPDASVHRVGREIIDRILVPKDHWEIAAQLEVMGIRDEDAKSDFGCADTFDLAHEILRLFNAGAFPLQIEAREKRERRSRFVRFLKDYANGLIFSLPMAIQATAMLLRGYGIWGAATFDSRTTTAMAIGVLSSYAVTGGFCQTIVRRGLFYISQEEFYLARLTAVRVWTISLALSIALLIPVLLFNLLYAFLPWDMVGLVVLYYVALSVLWLNFALIYLTKRAYLFAVMILAGVLVAFAAHEIFGAPILLANAIALFATDVLTFAGSIVFLTIDVRRQEGTRTASVPRLTILVYSTSLFFFYGALYNLFLFADRMMAWTSGRGRGDYLPYAIWVDGAYELGMDLALVVIVLLMGVVEHVTQRFSGRLIGAQEDVASSASDQFNRLSVRFYWKRMSVFALSAIVSIIGAYALFVLLRRYGDFPAFQMEGTAAIVNRVFWFAAIAYVFLMASLLNVLILLSLSRVGLVLETVAPALVVNIGVGFFCSRAIHYSLAVVGLLAGAIVFCVLSTIVTHRVMRSLDYHYYSAY